MNLRSPTMEDAQVHGAGVVAEIESRFGPDGLLAFQPTRDEIPTVWVDRSRLRETLQYLRTEIPRPFPMLFDLSATDERLRTGGTDP